MSLTWYEIFQLIRERPLLKIIGTLPDRDLIVIFKSTHATSCDGEALIDFSIVSENGKYKNKRGTTEFGPVLYYTPRYEHFRIRAMAKQIAKLHILNII